MPGAAEARPLDDAAVAALLPPRDPRSHKGSHGRLLCLCGSLEYLGAALLTCLAAVRAGAGLVQLAVPASLQPLVAGRVPEAITLGLPEARGGEIDVEPAVTAMLQHAPRALVAGPGLRETRDVATLLAVLLGRAGRLPVVLDGGALNLLSRSGEWWRAVHSEAVITPHPGEFERLTGEPVSEDDDKRAERCAAAAHRFGMVVVLKGANTVVAAPDGRLARSPFANAALATAGTGDVLAGTIGALLAQGSAAFDAACAGVYLHGAAAEHTSERLGDAGLAASDLPLEIALQRRRLARLRENAAGRVGFSRR